MMNADVLRKVTTSLRRRTGQELPSYSTMQIIEACWPNTLVTGRALIGADELVRLDRGSHWRDRRGSQRRHVLVYDRSLPTADQRYAIAHGIAHMVFDDKGSLRCHEEKAGIERRCDAFADELLLPLSELEHYVCAWPSRDPEKHEDYLDMCDLIASQFNVPVRIVHKRVRELQGLRR